MQYSSFPPRYILLYVSAGILFVEDTDEEKVINLWTGLERKPFLIMKNELKQKWEQASNLQASKLTKARGDLNVQSDWPRG